MIAKILKACDAVCAITIAACVSLASLFLWLLGAFLLVQELVHALGHNPHTPSGLAQAFGDFSPLPWILAAGLSLTVVVFLLTSWCSGGQKRAEDSSRAISLSIGTAMLAVAAFMALLLVLDFQHLGGWSIDGNNPFLHVAFSSILLYGLGAGVFFVQARLGALWPALAALLLPAPFLAALRLSPVARYQLTEWNDFLTPCFPRAISLLLSGAVVIVVFHALRFGARRTGGPAAGRHALVLSTSVLSYALFAFGSLGLIGGFHHLCLTDAYVELQAKVKTSLLVFFPVAWAVIIVRGMWLWLRREDGHPDGGEEIEDSGSRTSVDGC